MSRLKLKHSKEEDDADKKVKQLRAHGKALYRKSIEKIRKRE